MKEWDLTKVSSTHGIVGNGFSQKRVVATHGIVGNGFSQKRVVHTV